VSAVISALFVSGCASGRKQKLEQREKLAASSGLYCDFVNGDKNKEVEIELNVLMAKKCDSDRPFSITNYKSPAEVTGVLYCCAVKKDVKPADVKADFNLDKPAASPAKTEPKADVKKPAVPASATPPKGQAPVDKKATQPQDKKSNTELEEEIVPL
jgi:hypothetical protein